MSKAKKWKDSKVRTTLAFMTVWLHDCDSVDMLDTLNKLVMLKDMLKYLLQRHVRTHVRQFVLLLQVPSSL